jgi:hypothetical protein
MTLIPIPHMAELLKGNAALPSGAIPICRTEQSLICLRADQEWIAVEVATMGNDPQVTVAPRAIQRQVIDCLIERFMGQKGMAIHLGLSQRTIEAYRNGRARMTSQNAYKIACSLC